MEQSITQHTLTFKQGITNVPSDLLCADETLSSADGMVYINGEHKPVQSPLLVFDNTNASLMLVHELGSGSKNYIYLKADNTLFYTDDDGQHAISAVFDGDIKDISSVGNTLIVRTANGLHYILWKNTYYTDLGTHIPEPKVDFRLYDQKSIYKSLSIIGILEYAIDEKGNYYAWLKRDSANTTSASQKAWNDVALGLYAQLKNEADDAKLFYNPFFICYAVEMYDGSYYLISQPLLMLPSISANHYIYINVSDAAEMWMYSHELQYKANYDYSEWNDIIKRVTVFISNPTEVYDTTADCGCDYDDLANDSIYARIDSGNIYPNQFNAEPTRNRKNRPIIAPIKRKSAEDIILELKDSQVFYKLFELDVKESDSDFVSTKDKIRAHTLRNITTQDQLKNIDYYSHANVLPSAMQTFNRRLNLTGVSRSFFRGFGSFMPYQIRYNETSFTPFITKYIVTIESSIGNVTAVVYDDCSYLPGYWFYYPDPRAKHVLCLKSYDHATTWYKSFETDLKEHPGLNGAFALLKLPSFGETVPTEELYTGSMPTQTTAVEPLPNYLLQSEVDNPFSFNASGYVRVGQGTILGLAGLTTALNQDAYKVSTTLCFTTQGIWALTINSEGQYAGIHPPFSREVCNNPQSITMTDNAVFFTSEKGLMCVTGTSESSVVCVSDALLGSDFVDFCKDCHIAYDYKESLLLVFKDNMTECYIYSIKSGTWTHDAQFFASDSIKFDHAVVDYPDTLIQTTDSDVYSLLYRPNRNEDNGVYNGYLVTRPLKLDGSQILKSLRQLKALYDIDDTTRASNKISIGIEGSNDIKTWHTITSLTGKPFKFFRFTFNFTGLSATDTFVGITLITQKRYTERIL